MSTKDRTSDETGLKDGGATAGPNPPAGFEESTNRGPFTTHNGPFFHKINEDGSFVHAFRAAEQHCNGMGIVHGGLVTAFADGLMGTAVWRATDIVGLTIRLNADFLSIAKVGDWVEGTATVTRATRSVAFVEARVQVKTRPILHATGVFKLMGRHQKAR
ncbi:PaaI family thioesterase [Pyruvatibacter mobilis]|uniref:PaaI family thioesterase n=1 Tax=Pyruvatibacter mobilis TaxID=1712261 RepID=UPI003BA95DC0